MAQLDKEEKSLLQEYDKGEWKSVSKKSQKMTQYQEMAHHTFQKDKRVNIRISSRILESIQTKALTEGIPYQTLISSVLHKFVNGLLVEKKSSQ